MKIAFHLGRRPWQRTHPDQQLQRRTPRAPRATRAQRRREHRLALARRAQGARSTELTPGEAIGTLPRAPRRRLRLGRLWAHRIATGRHPGQRPRGPAFYL